MKLKSYFSGTVEAAMELARNELGEEALLVNARPAPPETRYLGEYEVVFGLASGALPQPASQSRGGNRLADEVAELKRELERMAQSLRASTVTDPPTPSAYRDDRDNARELSEERDGLYARLTAQDLEPSLAQSVAAGTPLEELVRTDSTLGIAGCSRRVVALVGPPGAGKTTTLVKLAARYGLGARLTAQILSADVHRIAAADQLCRLASILGIGCEIADTALALEGMLQKHGSKSLILIDTPGLTLADIDDASDLAELLGSHSEIETHLVLPGYLRLCDMSRVFHTFSRFAPKKLLFTRVDETNHFGALVGESNRCSLPISFLSNGQQIPDDLEPATPERLAKLILGAGPQPREKALLVKGAGA